MTLTITLSKDDAFFLLFSLVEFRTSHASTSISQLKGLFFYSLQSI